MRFQLALLATVLTLSACAARDVEPGATARTNTDRSDAASEAVNPTPPNEARSIPPSVTPPTLPEDPDNQSMPPGPVNPR